MGLSFSEEDERRRSLMEAIFREYFSDVHRYISRRVKQPDVADDLTSLVFIKAFRWLLEDRGIKQVQSWLYATARTTIVDYWQERQKNFPLPLELAEDSATDIFAQQDNKQTQKRVQHVLQLLPPREREVLFLRYLRGYTAAEVGQELGISANYVRVLQLRALRHAALLEEEERNRPMMNEPNTSYTRQGQQVLDLAKEEALTFNHYYIGGEHLLLGILREGSVAAPLIEKGTTLEHVRAGLLFLVGRDRGDPNAGTPFTPQAENILAQAGIEAQRHGETAISPHHILQALEYEELRQGITGGLLLALGIEKPEEKKQFTDENENERVLRWQERRVEQHPLLGIEEEQQLVHTIARSETEKIRAERLKETPDHLLLEEGETAYFRLIYASQHLVLSIAKEYLNTGRDLRKLINAGNMGLVFAITKFGMKTQVPFRSYATHWIHLEMIEALD